MSSRPGLRGTIAEQVLGRLAGRQVQAGEIVTVEPDRVMSHDNTAFVVKHFKATGRQRVWDPEKLVIVFDHTVPALSDAHQKNHAQARAFVAEQGLRHFFDAGEGVCHQLMLEHGLVLPGQLALGADSHSTLYGAVNALGIPINRTEMAGVWATGQIWLRVPETIRIELRGALAPGVAAKDVLLELLRQLRADGANYRSIEFAGPALAGLGISERMTLCNMAVELGAKCGVCPWDAHTAAWVEGRAGGAAFQPVAPTPDAVYAAEVVLELEALEPRVACPHTVDNVVPLSEVAGTPVQQGYLGSCTNGRLEDLRVAARILEGRRVAPGVRLVVYPASRAVLEAARAEGVLGALEAAGATIEAAACGPCFGDVGATLEAGQACISSSNRNFQGRMGSKDAFVYLSSPAVVAASCLEARIADPRPYLEALAGAGAEEARA